MTEIIRADGAILAKYIGGIIKQVSENGFRGHGVRYHDPNRKDLQGEWFSAKTYFMRNAGYPVIGIPVNYQHGLHKDFGNLAIGIVNFADEDEIGLLIEGEKKTREQYIEMLKEIGRKGDIKFSDTQLARKSELAVKAVDTLIAEVPLQFSGGFDPSTWLVDPETKHIDQAGMIHLAFTPTPADDLNPIVRFKSAIDEVLKYEPTTIYSLPSATITSHEWSLPEGAKLTITASGTSSDITPKPNQLPVTTGGTGHIGGKGSMDTDNEAAQPEAQSTTLDTKGHKQMSLEEMLALLRQLEEAMTAFGQQAGASEEDATMMAEEVTGELGQEDEEAVRSLTPETVAEKAFALLNAKISKQQAAAKSALAVFNGKANDHLKAQPATQKLPAYSGGNGSNGQAPRASVGEAQKYAHMSAEEMALAFKVLESAYHPTQRKRLTLGQMVEDGYVSPEFVKTWQHKAARTVDAFKFHDDTLGRQSESALKSIRFLKADELNSSDITGQGSELPGVFYDNTMWERARERTELFNMLVQRGLVTKDIPQGAETVEFKLDTSNPTVFTRHQARSVDSTGRPEVTARITPLGTGNLQATPAEHVLATSTTDILTEDSVINLVNYLNQDIQRTLAESLEDALINGDSETAVNTNINLIDGTPETGLSRPLYIAWDGFRKHALVTHSGQANNEGAALSIDTYFDTVAEFDDNAIESRTKELVFIVDKDTHRASRKLPELLTPGVAMQGATIYVGELPDIDGVAIYRSGFLSKSNTAGKISVTPGNNTKGQVVCVFPYYWGYGRKRAIQIENDRDIMAGVTVFVASVRHVLVARSAKAATISYNVTV
jgi:site-specific DNA-cytosine methylase